MLYAGCLGRPGSPLFRDPDPLTGAVDTLIIGGPFPHAHHPPFAEARQHLAGLIRDTVARGGQLIVPASSVGPVHEFVRAVQQLWRDGEIPELPVWLDTPAPIALPTVLRLHPESISAGEKAYTTFGGSFDQALVRQGGAEGGREALDAWTDPAIIIAPSEMGDTGRAAHHLRRCLGDPRHTVALLSFQEEGSVGRHLVDGATTVTLDGTTIDVAAHVEPMPAWSGHADGEEWRGWIRGLGGPIKRAFVVHGDDLAVAMMVTILREEGVRDVIVPRQGESFPF